MGRKTDDAKRAAAEANRERLASKWSRVRTAAATPSKPGGLAQENGKPGASIPKPSRKVPTGPWKEDAVLFGVEVPNLAGRENSVWEYADTRLGARGDKIKLADVAVALEYLTRVTGDPAFHTAMLALRGYGFDAPGLKASAKRFLAERGKRPEDAALLIMDPNPASVARASAEVAAAYGVAGTSLSNAADRVRKAYAQQKRSPRRPPADGNLGATGLWLKISLIARPSEGSGPVDCFGASFDEDGRSVVPDNRHWRRLISQGVVAHCGYAPAPASAGKS